MGVETEGTIMGTQEQPHRHDPEALARECAKLNPAQEKAMAEEGMTTAPTDWTVNRKGLGNRRQASPVVRILGWLQLVTLIVAAFGFVFFFRQAWGLLQPPILWPLFVALTGLGFFVLATIARDLARWFG